MKAESVIELLQRPDRQRHHSLVESFLDRFHETWPCGALEWVLRPMLHQPFVKSARGPSLPSSLGLVPHVVAAQARRRGVQILSQGRVAFAIDGTNLSRVLRPLIETRTADEGHASRTLPVLDSRRLFYWTKLATRYSDALIQRSKQAGLRVRPNEVRTYCLAGARALARAEGVLTSEKTGLLVVATQHAPNMRALVATARHRGVPSVYFPHAPTAANRQYADLPTDYAGLRGAGEVDFYRGCGVSGNLPQVGNPGVGDFLEDQARILKEAPVFAVPDLDPAVLADLFRLTVSAIGTEKVLVAPHPRSDRKELIRHLPSSWGLWSNGSTLDLLRRGPRFVVQHSSGVAWEALALGIPVIQLSYPNESANYPLIAKPFVLFAHSTPSLSEAVANAIAISSDRKGRDELRDWATYWCTSVGRRAREACVGLINQALQEGQSSDVLLDGWAFRKTEEGGHEHH